MEILLARMNTKNYALKKMIFLFLSVHLIKIINYKIFISKSLPHTPALLSMSMMMLKLFIISKEQGCLKK